MSKHIKKNKVLSMLGLVSILMINSLSSQTISYPDSSVLSSGDWYKIQISKDGIYKLTRADFIALGVPEKEIISSNLSIYGNGGWQIPLVTSEYKNSDLLENPIYIKDDNGNFGSGSYVLFYGHGNNQFHYNKPSNDYSFKIHPYSNTSTYFISFDPSIGEKKRIETKEINLESDTSVSFFRDYSFTKQELHNPMSSGRNWLGKEFGYGSSPEEFPLDMKNAYLDHNQEFYTPAKLRINLVARSSEYAYFVVRYNNQVLDSVRITPVTTFSESGVPNQAMLIKELNNASPSLNKIGLEFLSATASKGWLDYIILSFDRKLKYEYPNQMLFRNTEFYREGLNVEHRISNINSNDIIFWDITNPVNPQRIIGGYNPNENVYSLILASDSLRTILGFNTNSSLYSPTLIGKIENQNLHGSSPVDYVIITNPKFREEADSLAQIHETYNNTTTKVVEIEDIYNEFSSGNPDFLAYREYLRMLYNKYDSIGGAPKNVLLFGDGTFDNKNILKYDNNYVLTWQSENSLHDVISYPCEDYIAYLSPYAQGHIHMSMADTMLIGVGRFPVNTNAEARMMVDKSERYLRRMDLVNNEGLSDWRNTILLTSDDADPGDGYFVDHAESIYNQVKTTQPNLNAVKVYADAYKQYSSSAGNTYPDASKAINQQMKKGALIMNYVGHGSENHLASERLITIPDILSWDNYNRMALVITSTCTFARFDMVDKQSAGEYTILNENGGAVALISASRQIDSEKFINNSFHHNILERIDGRPRTFGEAFIRTKNDKTIGHRENKRSVLLLGDPALRISLPIYNIITDSITMVSSNLSVDTIKALQTIEVSGKVVDADNELLNDFNGVIQVTLFDKATNYHTLDNDGAGYSIEFEQQNNVLYRGRTSVDNGLFRIRFTLPKDLAYNYGNGKLSYYARSDSVDASGHYNQFLVGGIDSDVVIEETRPVIELYISDSNFVSGGITDEDPELFAILYDEIPINTVGSGLGHDIMAVLDNSANSFILNDYYEQDENDPNRGHIRYPFYNLQEGEHTLSLKAWNIFNFSNSASITFNVRGMDNIELIKLRNYPNPFTNNTKFYLEHNQKDRIKSGRLIIFNSQGGLVKSIEFDPKAYGYTIGPIDWDGRSDGGMKLQPGLYFYRMELRMDTGIEYTKAEKLIIL